MGRKRCTVRYGNVNCQDGFYCVDEIYISDKQITRTGVQEGDHVKVNYIRSDQIKTNSNNLQVTFSKRSHFLKKVEKNDM